MLEELAKLRVTIEEYRESVLGEETQNLRDFRLNAMEKVEWFISKGLFEKAEFAMACWNWQTCHPGFFYWHQLAEALNEAWDKRPEHYGPISESHYNPFQRAVTITSKAGLDFKRIDVA